MKVAIITDTHWSARKSSKIFQDYFERFYKEVFFPTLEENDIDTIIHLGDAFDSRKSIDLSGLEWTRRVVLDPISKYNVHLITGNHDCALKNTNRINSPDLLLKEYRNIKTYSSPIEVNIGKLNILLLPWINQENEKETFDLIKKTTCKVAMGHLELQGFRVNRQLTMESGFDGKLFEKFERVYSGHYHTRSDNGKIFYLGNPYEMFWSDVEDDRGFHIFDTETLEHKPINNPNRLFYNIYYNNDNYQTFDSREYENKIVKVIVKKKDSSLKFEKFIDKLYSSNVSELKIIENFEIEESQDFSLNDSEDTLTILNRYVEESEINLDKNRIQNMLRKLYQESCEVV
jgi:DNA repair exonuclease SbcCD nuclease subunit